MPEQHQERKNPENEHSIEQPSSKEKVLALGTSDACNTRRELIVQTDHEYGNRAGMFTDSVQLIGNGFET